MNIVRSTVLILLVSVHFNASALACAHNMHSGKVMSFVSNSIQIAHEHANQVNVMLHTYNFGNGANFYKETFLIEEELKSRGYNIVTSPQDADYLIQLTIKGEADINQDSLENIIKYWIYKEVTENMTKPGDNDSINFVAKDGKFGVSGGSQTATPDNESTSSTISSNFAKSGPLIITGAGLGGGIAATVWQTTSLLAGSVAAGPLAVFWSTAFGAAAGLIAHKITSEYPKIMIVDLTLMRRPSPGEKVEQKFSTLKKDAHGSWYEEYVFIKDPKWIRSSTRIYIVSKNTIFQNVVMEEKRNQIVNIISNLLPIIPMPAKPRSAKKQKLAPTQSTNETTALIQT